MNYLIISLVAFFSNIPCGYLRENTPKFSGRWFFWIHASIPLIIYIRLTTHVSAWFIPATITIAVLGQMVGSRWRKAKMTAADEERLQQIGSLKQPPAKTIQDNDILIALLNMGGPRTNDDVKDFQKHLFADPLLIRFPLSFLLQDFFAWLLIKFRLKAVKERYQEIGGGSPIYKSTTAQAGALRQELKNRGYNVDITFSFNY
ncbi:MAG: ferrochelatase, partial [Candidatus Omnitrophica bacterium]|nr:ferrochelatase [Candidatus Omnitrophota bacterium]